jgi:hypothetical protein
VTGRLEGKALTVGQRVTIQQGNMSTIPTDIKAIELHTAPA